MSLMFPGFFKNAANSVDQGRDFVSSGDLVKIWGGALSKHKNSQPEMPVS
jgi:hypothetical protein